jgi:predicted ester cyclase
MAVRDNGAMVRQIGRDVADVSRLVAALPVAESYVVAVPAPSAPQPARQANSMGAWARDLCDTVWNGRRLDRLDRLYDAKAMVHSDGGRTVQGLPAISSLVLAILAAIPDGVLTVENVCWADETDGIIVAVRWVLAGTSARGGILGDTLPVGRPVFMMGGSHLRLEGAVITEKWTVFDEVAVMAMAWRE